MRPRLLLLAILASATASSAFLVASASPRPRPPKRSRQSYDPSCEDIENIFSQCANTINSVFCRCRNLFHKNRPVVLAAGGVLGLMHGGTVAFTVMFIQSFGASGWPLVRSGLARGKAAYEEAKATHKPSHSHSARKDAAPLKRKLVELAEGLAELRRKGGSEAAQQAIIEEMRSVRRELEEVPPSRRAAPVLVAAFEPAVIRDVCLGLWSGITVSLAAACSSAARTIGLGVSLGEVVSNAGNAILSRVEPAIRKHLSRMPPEAVMLTYLGPSIMGTATLALLGRSVGCWVAHKLQNLAAVLSVSLLSARMLLEAIAPQSNDEKGDKSGADWAPPLPSTPPPGEKSPDASLSSAPPLPSTPRPTSTKALVVYNKLKRKNRVEWLHASLKPRREACAWILAVLSLQSQRSRGFKLPLHLQLPLLPFLGVEALLKRLAKREDLLGFPLPGGGAKRREKKPKDAWFNL